MRGFLLLAIQATMVLSVAAKYEWERHTCPTVWVRAEPFGLDADHMRTISGEGRYGRLQLHVDGCGLSTANVETEPDYGNVESSHKVLKTNVRTIARGGNLVAVDAGTLQAADVQEVQWDLRQPCTEARLLEIVDVYLPQNVQVPYTVPAGATLWALVTVPKSGPPRPVQLATSDAQGFHPWKAQR
jgi:hypothetical protein